MRADDPTVLLDDLPVDPVVNMRFDRLLKVGYPQAAAAAIAVKRSIDLHEAEALVTEKGCDPKVAADILL